MARSPSSGAHRAIPARSHVSSAHRNKPLAVIGGGDSAAEEATYLTKYGSHIYVLVRRDELRASKIMQKRLLNNPKIVSRSLACSRTPPSDR